MKNHLKEIKAAAGWPCGDNRNNVVRALNGLWIRSKDAVKRVSNFLKSLRPQPQHRDTYYDIIHDILATLKDMDFTLITPEHRVSLLNDIRVKCKNADECAEILDEPHWKPTKAMLDALNLARSEFHPDCIDTRDNLNY